MVLRNEQVLMPARRLDKSVSLVIGFTGPASGEIFASGCGGRSLSCFSRGQGRRQRDRRRGA